MVFGFLWTKTFASRSHKHLDVGAGAKKLRCLVLEPDLEIWVPSQQPCFKVGLPIRTNKGCINASILNPLKAVQDCYHQDNCQLRQLATMQLPHEHIAFKTTHKISILNESYHEL